MDFQELSKIISHALRHAPEEYGIDLDNEGWVEIESLLNALTAIDVKWKSLSVDVLQEMIDSSEKKRHEIEGNYIRAIYGHSVDGKFNTHESIPPIILYHGTSRASAPLILEEGLKPMSRQYVHLSQLEKEAIRVGKRKDKIPVILIIDAAKAFSEGVKFYIGNDRIWLSDYIPPRFIS